MRSPRAGTPRARTARARTPRSEEHTSELQSLRHLVCRLLLEKKKNSHSKPGILIEANTRIRYQSTKQPISATAIDKHTPDSHTPAAAQTLANTLKPTQSTISA